MKPQLDYYDWAEVFGEGTGGNCTPIKPERQPLGATTISGETFCREDVVEIYGQEDGENDGPDWIIYGQLSDGRFFAARGGCDYTGWDCQASNSGDVAETRELLERYGLTDDERRRFRITLQRDQTMTAKYKIGDMIDDSLAFGTVEVVDSFVSPTSNSQCYQVKDEEGRTYLCGEDDL